MALTVQQKHDQGCMLSYQLESNTAMEVCKYV